ncbi:MAG: T9SS type A sorting domain-containing protein [Flavobacteriaceae bacterium]|nr:T9SS type A sorting domain-containing protein [Flavobacteriaceae bacterium]
MKKLLYLFAFLAVSTAGAQDFTQAISTYLNSNKAQMGLTSSDVSAVTVLNSAYSKSMDVQTVHADQLHNGIPIFNSTSSFAIKNGTVLSASMSFQANVQSRANTSSPSVTPNQAVVNAANALGLMAPSGLELISSEGNTYLFNNGNISLNDIPVKLVYQALDDNSIRLAWDLSIYLKDSSHYYSVRIDAMNGQLLETMDWVVSCDFGKGDHVHSGEGEINFLFKGASEEALGGAEYRVFPLTYSSPLDGVDELVISPEDLTASPFGWHDTDGAGGAEFTITRGNNVWAQEDQNGNNGTGASPDGGAALSFDFPYDLSMQPSVYVDAATTNLFYWNNLCHDLTYRYGFDEENGNFQENNYGNGGAGSDSVNADAQDGGGQNNANFATPPDGSNPRMQMFLWDPVVVPQDILTINNGPLAGTYTGVPAAFGAPMPALPGITQDLVVVEDDLGGTADPNDACDAITNGADLNGKIAVIRRGSCEFGFKALAAENEGAVAVIIVYMAVQGGAVYPFEMGAGAVGASVTIPVFMVSDTDGEAIIAEALANVTNGTIFDSSPPPAPDLDGDLDNEIIAHEYAHGVSNRLTGGPTNVNCLNNDEQMGEGWSDYLGLIMTMQVGDTGADVRGLGHYASGNPNGIREAPYSTDFAVNDYTYQDTNAGVSQPHGIGFVWATMLWDMTWALIDLYGYDADMYEGTGGNNIALQLVMDGMKLQACSPGFVDGRDAIIMADELANGGVNKCLIWEVFANRGLGASADQGSAFSRTDQTEAYDLPPECNLGTGDTNFDKNFKIYPNPTYGTININSVVSLGESNVSIFDMNGRKVFSQNLEIGNRASVDASNLSAGVYVVKIDGGNYSHTAKLIIR